nr:MAG TPA: hypothetical protein [Caudoviricetes sp.]
MIESPGNSGLREKIYSYYGVEIPKNYIYGGF